MRKNFRPVIRLSCRIVPVVALALSIVSATQFNADAAGNNAYAQGVQAYGSHRYNDAVTCFLNAEKTAPADPAVRYYLGLSYQAINQISLAKQQYTWVAQQKANPGLAAEAQVALQQLSKYTTFFQGSQPTVSSAALAGFKPSAVQKFVGRAQVIEFYTDW